MALPICANHRLHKAIRSGGPDLIDVPTGDQLNPQRMPRSRGKRLTFPLPYVMMMTTVTGKARLPGNHSNRTRLTARITDREGIAGILNGTCPKQLITRKCAINSPLPFSVQGGFLISGSAPLTSSPSGRIARRRSSSIHVCGTSYAINRKY